jgi:hypothetical protein
VVPSRWTTHLAGCLVDCASQVGEHVQIGIDDGPMAGRRLEHAVQKGVVSLKGWTAESDYVGLDQIEEHRAKLIAVALRDHPSLENACSLEERASYRSQVQCWNHRSVVPRAYRCSLEA